MNKLINFLTSGFPANRIDYHHFLKKLSTVIAPMFLVLAVYSTTSLADYYVWYDNENRQEQQLYSGNTLLEAPDWACARKFTMPAYYRHLDTYHNTLNSADFWKDIYVWIPKSGCPYTDEAFIEYIDGSQSFTPPTGAIGIAVSTNYSSRWVDENGSWPHCHNCQGSLDFADSSHGWGQIFSELAILKSAILEKDVEKFNNGYTRTARLLESLEKDINFSIQNVDSDRSKEDQYRRTKIEMTALNQLSKARKQLDECASAYSADAYPSCDLVLQNLQQTNSLWRSRN